MESYLAEAYTEGPESNSRFYGICPCKVHDQSGALDVTKLQLVIWCRLCVREEVVMYCNGEGQLQHPLSCPHDSSMVFYKIAPSNNSAAAIPEKIHCRSL